MAGSPRCGTVATSKEYGGDRRQADPAVDDRVLDELGYYPLARSRWGGSATLMDEARRGEELGFGTAFISERFNVKEASRSSERPAPSPAGCTSRRPQLITTPATR